MCTGIIRSSVAISAASPLIVHFHATAAAAAAAAVLGSTAHSSYHSLMLHAYHALHTER